jgi:hypothetical protein
VDAFSSRCSESLDTVRVRVLPDTDYTKYGKSPRYRGVDRWTAYGRSLKHIKERRDRLAEPPDSLIVVDCRVNAEVKHRFYDTVDEPP